MHVRKTISALLTALALVLCAALTLSVSAAAESAVPKPATYRDGDGMYTIRFTLDGGDGSETLHSPATLNVEDEKAYAIITWDSATYKTLTLDGTVYKSSGDDKNARFEFPVTAFDEPMTIVMDDGTEYRITFDKSSISSSMMMGLLLAGTAVFIAFVVGTRLYLRRNDRKGRRR